SRGLIEAARRFDPACSVKFTPYAVGWVRESLLHVLADQPRAFSFPPKLFATLRRGPGAGADVSLNEPVNRGGFGDRDGASRELGDLLEQGGVPAGGRGGVPPAGVRGVCPGRAGPPAAGGRGG